MKLSLASLCFIFLLFLTALAAAQNNAYSSYYTYTVVYNADGSANVTPTAEVSGIDDVSDWVEGSYRPVCTVRPKIQLNGDGVWVGGTRVALGRAVDQVHTGQSVYVPANGSTVGLDFAVEADVACSGVPNPTYYQYPTLAYLGSWSNIDFYFWSLEGFEPAQYAPPYYIAYCPSAAICPVNYGVASIKNFVDFADFLNWKVSIRDTYYGPPPTKYLGACYYTLLACSTGTPTCRQSTPGLTWVPDCPNYMDGKYLVINGWCSFGIGISASGPGVCN